MLLKVASYIWCHFFNLQIYDTKSAHVPKRVLQMASEKPKYIVAAFLYVSVTQGMQCFMSVERWQIVLSSKNV